MSGGSWDYVYMRFYESAHRLIHGDKEEGIKTNKERKKLGLAVKALSEAMKEIEWIDSGDTGKEYEKPAIDAFFKTVEKIAKK